jgi:hypothetical protein
MKMTVFWDVAPMIVLMMEAGSVYEAAVSFYETTQRNILSLLVTFLVPTSALCLIPRRSPFSGAECLVTVYNLPS